MVKPAARIRSPTFCGSLAVQPLPPDSDAFDPGSSIILHRFLDAPGFGGDGVDAQVGTDRPALDRPSDYDGWLWQ